MTNIIKKAQQQQITQTSEQLFTRLQSLITAAKKQVASQVNAALTQLYWHIGKQINNELLQQQRAEYGQAIVKVLSGKLTDEFGKGFNYSALTRMQKFYNAFSDETKVATLSQQLSWSHIVLLLPIKDPLAQGFYAQMSASEHWSVRTLRNRIDSMLFERTAVSKKPDELIKLELAQLENKQLSANMVLKDPYMLDFLGVQDHYFEKDLEDAILRDLEQFLLELGSGFSFIGRQHRVQIGQEDFYIDLLFYNRKLKRLTG
jgi:predicted nuclease of restriction endonuclease-like (RecB) superfamily